MLSEEEIQESLISHEGRNGDQIETLRARGVGLDKPRRIEHHFWATSQRDAAHLARDLHERGFLILALAAHDAGDGASFWNVEAEIECPPVDAGDRAATEELVRLAGGHDAIYDGWGIDI
jgi:regulator of RNase E activity RraB